VASQGNQAEETPGPDEEYDLGDMSLWDILKTFPKEAVEKIIAEAEKRVRGEV
jgi:hypothetical protein